MFHDSSGTSVEMGRRQFLAAASAAVAMPLVAQAAEANKPRWKMRLSTSSIHYLSLPVEQACERIAKLGFPAVDIWSAHAGCPHLDDVAKRLGGVGLKKVLRREQLDLCSFSVYQGGYARYAELLGGSGGGVAIRSSAGPCPPSELTSRMRTFLESLRPELELAEKYDSYLAIENHGHALLDSTDSLKAFADLNRSRRLGIAFAPYHIQLLNESIEKAIAACGSQLMYFYAWQHGKGIEQLPGIGPVDFSPWLAALAKINYQGYVNPFMHGEIDPAAMDRALEKSKAYLDKCYAKMA